MSKLKWQQIKLAPKFHAHEIRETEKLPGCVIDHLRKIGAEELTPFQFKAFEEKRIIGVFTSWAVFAIIGFDSQHVVYKKPH